MPKPTIGVSGPIKTEKQLIVTVDHLPIVQISRLQANIRDLSVYVISFDREFICLQKWFSVCLFHSMLKHILLRHGGGGV